MTKSSKVIFFGNERLASGVVTTAPVLSALIKAGYEIAFVVVNQASEHGRRQRELEVEAVAQKHKIPVLRPKKVVDILPEIEQSRARLGVLVAYGRMIPDEVIKSFPLGIVNIHPSLLPKYRGSSPIEAAILNGDSETGVSLMQLVHEMDAGPILGFAELALEGSESKQELYDQLSELGAQLLTGSLPAILDGQAQPMQQDHEKASYAPMINKSDGQIDWSKPARQLERQVRAYLGWPGSHTELAGRSVTITKAHVTNQRGNIGDVFVTTEKNIGVFTSEAVLVIERLKPAGKREMTAQEFLAGHQL